MKIINPNAHALVIMTWDEFRSILEEVPDEGLICILVKAGLNKTACEKLTRKQLIDNIFIELEEQVE